MNNHWNLLGEIQEGQANDLEATCFVPADSPWFKGHFPGEPVLPGIALVRVVQQAILHSARKNNEHIMLSELKRIRFVQPVRPNQTLQIKITRENVGDHVHFSFKIVSGESMVSSGLIIGKRTKDVTD